MEQLDYNLLFRWFVGVGIDDAVWERSVFSPNRERLLSESLCLEFFTRFLAIAKWQNMVSDEHISLDGSLIESLPSQKASLNKDGSGPGNPAGRNPEIDFSGVKRSNTTHQITTDSEARLFKKSEFTEAKPGDCVSTHSLYENRNGLIVDVETTQVNGKAEIEAAHIMIKLRVPKGGRGRCRQWS